MNILVIGKGSIGSRHYSNLVGLGVAVKHIAWREFSEGCFTLDADIDGVVIATATHVRYELIELCATVGVPFYVEKPLCFRRTDLKKIIEVAAPVASRSFVGFMMRYHPGFRELAQSDLNDTFGFRFEIGHDVNQWRQGWQFSQSYAALPEGGGVLLDLCHELDMAATLFKVFSIGSVHSLGHVNYPGVDFATQISLTAPSGVIGTVMMDYLSPVFNRTISLRGLRQTHDFDLVTDHYQVGGIGAREFSLPFERNDMFLSAMRDFLALVKGRPTSGVEHIPRFDLVQDSCTLIANAWEERVFTGYISKDMS